MGEFKIGSVDESSSTGLMILGAGALLLIGLYYMAKRNAPAMMPYPPYSPYSTAPSSIAGLYPGAGVPGISPVLDYQGGSSGPISLGATPGGVGSNIIQYPTADKMGVPIISPSTRDLTNPEQFAPTAAGTCQCTSSECCYWSPFTSAYGTVSNYQSSRVCAPVLYGNTPQSCQAAMSQHTSQTAGIMAAHRARAYDAMAHFSHRPVKARKAMALLASRAARARAFV